MFDLPTNGNSNQDAGPDRGSTASIAEARRKNSRARKLQLGMHDRQSGQPLQKSPSIQVPPSYDRPEKKALWLEALRLGLMPLVLGLISFYVTQAINTQQIKSANEIAEQQLTSSKQIAAANLKTQHLSHMVQIFSEIIDDKTSHKQTKHGNHSLVQRIQSLQIYGNEALPFLVQLRAHYESGGKHTLGLLGTTKKVIKHILQESQLDFHGSTFIAQTPTRINLRKKNFENFNLSASVFEDVNLYRANFTEATLKKARFKNVDLQETSFRGANLDGVEFDNANLRKTDFTQAYLYGAIFAENCTNIEDAFFTLEALLHLYDHPQKHNPIQSIPNEAYTILLMKQKKALISRIEQQPASLKDAYKKLGIEGSEETQYEELQRRFDRLRETLANSGTGSQFFALL